MSNRHRFHHKQHNNYAQQQKYSRTPYDESYEYDQQEFASYGAKESGQGNRTSHAHHTRTGSFPVRPPFKKGGRGRQGGGSKNAQPPHTARPRKGHQNRYPSTPTQTNQKTGHSHTSPEEREWRPKKTEKSEAESGKADMVMFEHETLEKSLGSTEKKKKLVGTKALKQVGTAADASTHSHGDITIDNIKDASKHVHMIPVVNQPNLLTEAKADQRGGSAPPPVGRDEDKSKLATNISIQLPASSGTNGHDDSSADRPQQGDHPSSYTNNPNSNANANTNTNANANANTHSQGRPWFGNPRSQGNPNAGAYRGAMTPSHDGRRRYPPHNHNHVHYAQGRRGGRWHGKHRQHPRDRHTMTHLPNASDFAFAGMYGYGQEWYASPSGPVPPPPYPHPHPHPHSHPYHHPQHPQSYYRPPPHHLSSRPGRDAPDPYPRYNPAVIRGGYPYTPLSMTEAQYYQHNLPNANTDAFPETTSDYPRRTDRAQTPPPRSKQKESKESLSEKIKAQVEYYFSEDNLAKDEFLQGLMDSEGWVKARFLEQFPRLQKMQVSAKDIVAAITQSQVVETLNNKIRRKQNWENFIPASEKISNRFLEAMAIRIADHHAKLQKLQKMKGSTTEKKETNSEKSEKKATVSEEQKNNNTTNTAATETDRKTPDEKNQSNDQENMELID